MNRPPQHARRREVLLTSMFGVCALNLSSLCFSLPHLWPKDNTEITSVLPLRFLLPYMGKGGAVRSLVAFLRLLLRYSK